MDCANVFVSVLPGRIRLRHPLLRNHARHAALCDRLRPLLRLESNPAIGSILLSYDPADSSMEARIRAEVDAVLAAMTPNARNASESSADSDVVARHGRQWQSRPTINRVAKIGALAGFAASLSALGVSRKLHAQLGVVAAAMTLTHVAMHWRRVPR